MIGEFVDAWFTVILAAVLWVGLLSGLAATAVVGAGVWLGARLAASQRIRAAFPPCIRHKRHNAHTAPLWARSQPIAYEEPA